MKSMHTSDGAQYMCILPVYYLPGTKHCSLHLQAIFPKKYYNFLHVDVKLENQSRICECVQYSWSSLRTGNSGYDVRGERHMTRTLET